MNDELKNRILSQRGFSFLELVVVIALTGIIAGVVSQLFVFGVDTYNDTITRKDLVPTARIAAEFLMSDLRTISDADNISTATATDLVFANIDYETISYSYDSGILTRNSKTLLEGLNEFLFDYSDVDGSDLGSPVSYPNEIWKIGFSLSATINGQPFELSSSIVPRKF